MQNKQWNGSSIYPLYSPMSPVVDGSANYGIELAFDDAELLALEKTARLAGGLG